METVLLRTFVYLLLVHVNRSHNVEVSKACYGTQGSQNKCTRHELDCKGGKIAIQDAFHSHNASCRPVGLSACDGVVVGNLTYNKRAEFNETLTEQLYRQCSLRESCNFDAGRNGTRFNLSVLKYICINESRNICDENAFGDHNKSLLWNKTSHMNESYTCSCGISANTTEPTAVYALDMRPRSACTNLSITAHETCKNCTQNIQYQLLANTTWTINLEPVDVFDILWINIRGNFEVNCRTKISPRTTTSTTTSTTAQNTGAIAGGVVGVILVGVIVAAVLLWFKFVRNKRKDKKPEKEGSNHGSLSRTAIQDGDSRILKAVSNYDYATIHDGVIVGRAQQNFVLAGEPNTKNGTVLMEDEYNHINHNPQQGAPSPGYDTTASAAAAMEKLKNASSKSIDDDDYNHLGDGKPSVVSSDYDTTVSASKAVAQLGEMKESEDDYDHFKRSEGKIIDSPYDTANNRSSASSDKSSCPYDLAK